jgi:hypothetical protein
MSIVFGIVFLLMVTSLWWEAILLARECKELNKKGEALMVLFLTTVVSVAVVVGVVTAVLKT